MTADQRHRLALCSPCLTVDEDFESGISRLERLVRTGLLALMVAVIGISAAYVTDVVRVDSIRLQTIPVRLRPSNSRSQGSKQHFNPDHAWRIRVNV